ncbi:MAG: UDP-N-acetylmuramoyl-tripeptide--D-alanyl-D-alanine ligase [Sphingorhabdus sp.]
MNALWTSGEIAAATGGTASAEFACSGVAFDSREIGKGDLFFALKGEHSDGHLFTDQAFSQGAAGAVVSEQTGHPHVDVTDTYNALNDLATASRKRADAKIIGVTGSAGKTGTKEALFAALDRSSRGKAHRSVKSYNNHVGVPLSLARMPREAKFAVFEMGMNHPGELSELTKLVRPDIAIVTTIAPAHIGFFKDEAEIAKAKSEIFEGLSESGAAIIPADSPHFDLIATEARKYTTNVISFGFSESADIRVIDHVDAENGGTLVTAKLLRASLCYTISQAGRHWIANSLAVLAAVETAGADLAAAGLALAELDGMKGRGARQEISVEGGKALLIDESYNANPASMAATIEQLGSMASSRRVVVLGAMKELGEQSDHYHKALAVPLAAANIDYALLVGEEMKILSRSLASGVEGARKFDHCGSAEEALEALRSYLRADDAVLVKGSNSVGLSKIVSELTAGEN